METTVYAASYQLTNFVDEALRRLFPSPVDNSIIFFEDHHGTENFQIYKIDDTSEDENVLVIMVNT
jgi:hypothetical protein